MSLSRKTLFIKCFKLFIMKKLIQKFITLMKSDRESFVKSNRDNNSAMFTYDLFQNAYKYLQKNAKVRKKIREKIAKIKKTANINKATSANQSSRDRDREKRDRKSRDKFEENDHFIILNDFHLL